MGKLSKGSSIWNSEVNEELVKLQNYCEEFIFLLKHHTRITEVGVQDITTCLETGRSEENASTIISIRSIDITPINRDMLKQVE